MRILELKQKEVINICDCRRIGCVGDVDIDIVSGKVVAIIIPGPARIAGIFGREMEYIIFWNQIRQIGPDIILVEIKVEESYQKCKW